MEIAVLDDGMRAGVDSVIAREWMGPMVVSRGNLIDTRTLPGFTAVEDEELLGAVLYRMAGGECEIVVLFSLREGRGIGTALIAAVGEAARAAACRRVWLITTNDNLHAIGFYQKRGFNLRTVHMYAVDRSRRLKPQIPLRGADGIPIRHELEFELLLQ